MSDYRRLSLVALLFACRAGHAFAAEKPLWELGAGISAPSLPDYRGSDQASVYAIVRFLASSTAASFSRPTGTAFAAPSSAATASSSISVSAPRCR